MKLIVLAGACILIGWAALTSSVPQPALAHGNLIKSEPEDQQVLATAPTRVVLWFSEPIEENFSDIQVLNPVGERVDIGGAALVPTEPTAMTLALPPLTDGTYVVAWNNLSSIDGHRVFGSFGFAVGNDTDLAALDLTAEQPLVQSPADPFLRWVAYLGTTVALGGLLLQLLVLSPALRHLDTAPSWMKHLNIAAAAVLLGLVALVVAQLGLLVQQAIVTTPNAPFSEVPSVTWQIMTGTTWGRLWAGQTVAAVGALLVVTLAERARRRSAYEVLVTENLLGMIAIALTITVLVLRALASHNAASPEDVRTPALLTQLIHSVSVVAWVGVVAGFVLLYAAIRRRGGRRDATEFAHAVVPKITPVALVAATALLVSGTVATWLQVTVVEALVTPYGVTLVAKIVLVSVLLVVAALNSVVFARRLPACSSSHSKLSTTTNRIFRLAVAEIALGALIVLAAATLASLEPARQYAGRSGLGVPEGVSFTATNQAANITVSLLPGSVGDNEIAVRATTTNGAPLTSVVDVRVRVRAIEQNLGEPQFSLIRSAPGKWLAQDYRIPLAGLHQIDVALIRTDAFDSRLSFRFQATPSGIASDPIRPNADTAWTLLGVELALIAAMLALVVSGSSLTRRVTPARAIATTAVVVGILLALNPLTLRVGFETLLVNPTPATTESINAGQVHYLENCSRCHGQSGFGDGAQAAALGITPADLTVHTPLHTDADLYTFVDGGIIEAGMPAFNGTLQPHEIWDLVNFLRVLVEPRTETVTNPP